MELEPASGSPTPENEVPSGIPVSSPPAPEAPSPAKAVDQSLVTSAATPGVAAAVDRTPEEIAAALKEYNEVTDRVGVLVKYPWLVPIINTPPRKP
jgi:hypothetical protein